MINTEWLDSKTEELEEEVEGNLFELILSEWIFLNKCLVEV
jgi:hypothetical protein